MPTQLPPPSVTRRLSATRAILALMLREMATRYGRSPGGYAWALLEPLGGILLMSVVFSLVVRTPPLGNSFILFFATGYLPFNIYQSLARNVSGAIGYSRALLFYPAVTWVDALLARLILNALTDVLAMAILFAGILSFSDTHVVLDFLPILTATGLTILLGAGIGVLNCALFGILPVWKQVWSILTRPLFLLSGVLFLFDTMPPFAREILYYNPLQHIIGLMRTGFYPTYTASFVNPAFVTGVALGCMFLGVVLMGRYHREILNEN